MFLRINDVTVAKGRVDELRDVLSNKALPVVVDQKGCRALLCAADRATGNCAIVSMWDSKRSLEASEKAIASIRSATVDAVDAKLNSVVIAEVLREITIRPSHVGCHDARGADHGSGSEGGRVARFLRNEGRASSRVPARIYELAADPRA